MFLSINGVGTLTTDPEIKHISSGACVANFSIVSNETHKGEQKVCFTECTVFGGLAEKVVAKYLKKGSKIYICGKLKFESWADKNGGKRSKHSVVVDSIQMLDSKSSESAKETYKEEVDSVEIESKIFKDQSKMRYLIMIQMKMKFPFKG